MRRLLITLLSLFLSFISLSQLSSEEIVESNKLNCDQRILLHYTHEDILSMDSMKFEMIKYYYCDSYILDTTNSVNFDINKFDISLYESYRKEEEYYTFEIEGTFIKMIPKNLTIYLIDNDYKKNKRYE